MVNTVRRLAVLASLTLVAIGCRDAGGPTSPIAPYELSLIGTSALPVVLYSEEGYSLEVTAGAVELKADSTYTMELTVLETVDGNKSTYTDIESGTWLQGAAGAVTLTSTTAESFTAVWSGTTLTVTRSEVVYVYNMTDS